MKSGLFDTLNKIDTLSQKQIESIIIGSTHDGYKINMQNQNLLKNNIIPFPSINTYEIYEQENKFNADIKFANKDLICDVYYFIDPILNNAKTNNVTLELFNDLLDSLTHINENKNIITYQIKNGTITKSVNIL